MTVIIEIVIVRRIASVASQAGHPLFEKRCYLQLAESHEIPSFVAEASRACRRVTHPHSLIQ